MTLWDLIKYTFWVGVLVLATTGISFFDKGSRAVETRADISEVTEQNQAALDLSRSGGARVEEGGTPVSSLDTTFVAPDASPDILPIRDWNVADPVIEARAALLFDPSRNKILYEKNIYEQLPIASITKLVTAITVLDFLDPEEAVSISKTAVATESAAGNLMVGEQVRAGDLLKALLIESSNDAAVALEEHVRDVKGGVVLVDEMNKKAAQLGLAHTVFKTVSGLDSGTEPSNFSTARSLAILGERSWENELIRGMISTSFETVFSIDGRVAHHLANSNRLLGVLPEMWGSKTGYTEAARESMVSIVASPEENGGHVVIVVLGTSDRERDTRALVQWMKSAYRW